VENKEMDIYSRIFEQTPDALIVVDRSGRIAKINARTELMFGYARDELEGREIERLVPKRFAARHAAHTASVVASPTFRRMGTSPLEMFALRKDGVEFPVDIMIAPLDADEGVFTLCAVRDITAQRATEAELRRRAAELEELHEQLKVLASRDALTGLFNRRAFQEHVEWLLGNSARRKESVSLLLIDLDFFKQINDQFGHAEGDRVLEAVAATLQSACRQNDLPARYGGEEFAVALPDTSVAGSLVVAENLRAAIHVIGGLKVITTASIGIVSYTPQPDKPTIPTLFAELVSQADRALYAAKDGGRNRVCHVSALTLEGAEMGASQSLPRT
jgi:diguanylate cyclase (GGDEF)-like protein/PAS domain S-box-containing protein